MSLLAKTGERLEVYRQEIRRSKLLADTVAAVKLANTFTHIRCLALGPPCDSKPALYQLGYILELADSLDITESRISFYDPIFSQNDRELLNLWVVEDGYDVQDIKSTLFFLPHAGLDLTETILNEYLPRWMLANNLITHTERISLVKLHDNYESISTLVKIIEKQKVQPPVDGFITPKKKRNQKYVFKQPEIVYDFEKVYFGDFKMTVLGSDVGDNAFTDLSFQHIIPKEEVKGENGGKSGEEEEEVKGESGRLNKKKVDVLPQDSASREHIQEDDLSSKLKTLQINLKTV